MLDETNNDKQHYAQLQQGVGEETNKKHKCSYEHCSCWESVASSALPPTGKECNHPHPFSDSPKCRTCLIEELAEQDKRIAEQEQQYADLAIEMSFHCEKIASLESSLEGMKERNAELEAKYQRAGEYIKDLESESKSSIHLMNQNAFLDGEISELKKKLKTAEGVIAKLNDSLADMEKSRDFWKDAHKRDTQEPPHKKASDIIPGIGNKERP